MRQVVQDLGSGATTLIELPRPRATKGGLLIRSRTSLLSAGTERMLVDFGRAGLLSKARQQPEKVQQVLGKIRSDGFLPTLDAVRSKLSQPIPLGYCNAGVVVEVGEGVDDFEVGDRVASNGHHADFVSVPRNLCARVPTGVPDDTAAFTVIGSIGLQGLRLVQPMLGECFVVTGLGLIGLITVQLLHAHGCRVLGIDFDPAKLALAEKLGARTVHAGNEEEVLAVADAFSRGRGVDGVLLTAATTSSEPVSQAARMCRKRGRIVLVGVVGLELNRSDFFQKELTFQVSCSYGPGRYDSSYEEGGQDYPVGFVRWTEQRNFEAVLDMMADGRIDTGSLVSHRFAFHDAPLAYDLLASDDPSLGILFEYEHEGGPASTTVTVDAQSAPRHRGTDVSDDTRPTLGVIGAGNYAGRVLIPAFTKAGGQLVVLANRGGVSGAHYAKKHGIPVLTTDVSSVLEDDRVRAVVVATRHDSHAEYVCRALKAGKDVFCEKPLCISLAELSELEAVWADVAEGERAPILMVGFNRRFAPLVRQAKELIAGSPSAKAFTFTVNAGATPVDHWTQDPAVGGGRIVGEGCHFIDLLRYLAGAPIVRLTTSEMRADTSDTMTITLTFADGSIGSVHYFSNGNRALAKERLEVFVDGRTLHLDNFRRLTGHGWRGFKAQKLWRQDKGQAACAAAFLQAVRTRSEPPIPVHEIFETARVSIEAAAGR